MRGMGTMGKFAQSPFKTCSLMILSKPGGKKSTTLLEAEISIHAWLHV